MLTKKLIFQLLLCILLLGSCSKKNKDSCPSVLKLTASSITPTVGDRLTLYAGNGQSIYNWVGPQNFAIVKTDGSDILEFADIKINQSGWYYCGASIPGCTTLSDSIYIEVKYKQGKPTCILTNNLVTGTGIPDLQPISVSKEFDNGWNCMSLFASGNFGYPTYTILFNSYNGNNEPKNGIYLTSDIQVFNPFQNANVIFIQCQYSNYFFKSKPDQQVYVSHLNDKLSIAFCGLDFAGDNGNGNIFTSVFTGQLTVK